MSGRSQISQTHSSRRDILKLGVEDSNGLSRGACSAASEEQSASAGHHALVVTDHTVLLSPVIRRATAFRLD